MIPINISPDTIVTTHFENTKDRIRKSIKYVLKNGCKHKGTTYDSPTGDERNYLNSLLVSDNLQKLITAPPDELETIRANMLGLFPNIHTKNNDFNRILYKIFITDAYGTICKHSFIGNIKINTCPYCNRNYTYSLSRTSNIKPELDHFYPKSLYPYFGVSFYNLIPSCQTCNGLGVKGEKDCVAENMKSPYLMKHEEFQFSYNIKKLDYLSPINGDNDIEVKLLKRVEGNNTIFKLDELYQLHNDHVLELIIKSKVNYSEKYRDYLRSYSGLTFNDDEINRAIIGNYTKLSDLHKRPFSKLYRDIALELGLII